MNGASSMFGRKLVNYYEFQFRQLLLREKLFFYQTKYYYCIKEGHQVFHQFQSVLRNGL